MLAYILMGSFLFCCKGSNSIGLRGHSELDFPAGVPVNLSSAKKLVEMIDEQDFVGIQPTRKYKYYTIYDGEIGNYTSLRGDDNDEKIIANAVWE